MKTSKLIVYLLPVLARCPAAWAAGPTESPSSISAMGQKLKQLKVTRKNGEIEIKFCPDNTCDIVKARGVSEEIAGDFAYLFFYYTGAWNDDEFKAFTATSKKRVAALLEKNLGACSSNEPGTPLCVLKAMKDKYHFATPSRTLDEGQECDTEYPLEDLINHTVPAQPQETKCRPLRVIGVKQLKSRKAQPK